MSALPLALAAALLSGCGGESWVSDDASSAAAAVHCGVLLESVCSGETCQASRVRALNRCEICNDASRLSGHGEKVPDLGGVSCLPR